jgi:NNP family nitrate/nitrite transporter-like MFS transporter
VVVGIALQATGSPHAAWYVFIAFYLSCVLGTWYWYRRKESEIYCE